MLSLVKIAGAIEVHLLGYYVPHRSIRFDHAIPCEWTRTQTTSPFETVGVSKGTFHFLEEGTGHVSRIVTPLDTT